MGLLTWLSKSPLPPCPCLWRDPKLPKPLSGAVGTASSGRLRGGGRPNGLSSGLSSCLSSCLTRPPWSTELRRLLKKDSLSEVGAAGASARAVRRGTCPLCRCLTRPRPLPGLLTTG